MTVNQKQLADILGITTRRVRQLREEGFFNFTDNGKNYILERCVQEYIEYKVKAEVPQGATIVREKEQAEHERIKKDISALKLRKMKKEIHEAIDIELYLSEMLINFKNRFLSIPQKIAISILGEKDINRIILLLQKEILETLEELSEYDPDKINRTTGMQYDDTEGEDGDDIEE